MTLLTWNAACTVGVRAMDDQHGVLLDTINELRLAVLHANSAAQIRELLDRLIRFTSMHFASEERLMDQFGFPGLAAHHLEHQRLMTLGMKSAHSFLHGEGGPTEQSFQSLHDWFINHIASMDRTYGTWLNDRGVL